MMTEESARSEQSVLRKLAMPILIGAVLGFVTMFGVSKLTSGDLLEGLSTAAEMAVLVGAFYILAGVGVGFGALHPRIGAKILNVEDVEEIEELKGKLVTSCIAMALWGAALIIIALGGEGVVIAARPALIGGVAMLVIGSGFAWASYRASDELMQMLNAEATVLAYSLTLGVVGIWAMAAHLDLARAQEPIEMLTMFYVIAMLATFIATGRRGLLAPR